MKQSFEKLEVWNKSIDLVKSVYKLSAHFPNSEKFGITDQLRRAAISVSSNIAEGSGKIGNKDKIRFISISYGSLMETINLALIAKELKYIDENDLTQIRNIQIEISKMLSGLRKVFRDQLTSNP